MSFRPFYAQNRFVEAVAISTNATLLIRNVNPRIFG